MCELSHPLKHATKLQRLIRKGQRDAVFHQDSGGGVNFCPQISQMRNWDGTIESASSIVKCNTWVSRKESAILSVYAKNLCSSYRNRA